MVNKVYGLGGRDYLPDQAELVLGIDDFAIKKGHTYNTGIHDLRDETMLDLLSGRKLDALRTYAEQHPEFLTLNPKAVVMDLAQTYHTWISECFQRAFGLLTASTFTVTSLKVSRPSENQFSLPFPLGPKGF